MFRRTLPFVLVVSMVNAAGAGAAYAAGSGGEKEARFAERVRAGIGKLGAGTGARVEVELRNKMRLKGYVGRSDAESFTVIDANGVATEVAYPQVRKVKGNNLSEGVKIAIVVGIVAVAVILAATVFAGD